MEKEYSCAAQNVCARTTEIINMKNYILLSQTSLALVQLKRQESFLVVSLAASYTARTERQEAWKVLVERERKAWMSSQERERR